MLDENNLFFFFFHTSNLIKYENLIHILVFSRVFDNEYFMSFAVTDACQQAMFRILLRHEVVLS